MKEVLLEMAKSDQHVRFYGPGMIIVAEGIIDHVGDDFIAIKHSKSGAAEEYVLKSCIIKIQILKESRHF